MGEREKEITTVETYKKVERVATSNIVINQKHIKIPRKYECVFVAIVARYRTCNACKTSEDEAKLKKHYYHDYCKSLTATYMLT